MSKKTDLRVYTLCSILLSYYVIVVFKMGMVNIKVNLFFDRNIKVLTPLVQSKIKFGRQLIAKIAT